jgi:quercetin dioxygenase-like cupin family protein
MATPNPKPSYLQDVLQDKAVIFRPGEGETLSIKGGKITLKVTSSLSNDQLGIYEISLEPGTVGAALHFHRFMDETFIVTEGTLTVQHGSEEVAAMAGSVIYVPRFTPHGFANKSNRRATALLAFNPAFRREGFFHGLAEIMRSDPINQADFLALNAKYDSFPVK